METYFSFLILAISFTLALATVDSAGSFEEPLVFRFLFMSSKGDRMENIHEFTFGFSPYVGANRAVLEYGGIVISLMQDESNAVLLLKEQRVALRLRNLNLPHWRKFLGPAANFFNMSTPLRLSGEAKRQGQRVGQVSYLGFLCDIYLVGSRDSTTVTWITKIGSEEIELLNVLTQHESSGNLLAMTVAVEVLQGDEVPEYYLKVPDGYQIIDVDGPDILESLYTLYTGSEASQEA